MSTGTQNEEMLQNLLQKGTLNLELEAACGILIYRIGRRRRR